MVVIGVAAVFAAAIMLDASVALIRRARELDAAAQGAKHPVSA